MAGSVAAHVIVTASFCAKSEGYCAGNALLLALVDGRDVLLSRVAGVGKAKLLEALDDQLLVVEPLAVEHLADDLQARRLRFAAVDDANLQREALLSWDRLKGQEGAVRASRVILDQAQGGPGCAVTLCRAVVDGSGRDVAIGQAYSNRLVDRICQRRSWSGAESDAITADIRWFEEATRRDSRLAPLAEIAISRLSREVELAVSRERHQAVRGWG